MATGNIGGRTILQKRFEFAYTNIAANNGIKAITANNIGYSIPNGYTPLGFPVLTTGTAGVFCQSVHPTATGDEKFAQLCNTNTEKKSGTFVIEMTFIAKGECDSVFI